MLWEPAACCPGPASRLVPLFVVLMLCFQPMTKHIRRQTHPTNCGPSSKWRGLWTHHLPVRLCSLSPSQRCDIYVVIPMILLPPVFCCLPHDFLAYLITSLASASWQIWISIYLNMHLSLTWRQSTLCFPSSFLYTPRVRVSPLCKSSNWLTTRGSTLPTGMKMVHPTSHFACLICGSVIHSGIFTGPYLAGPSDDTRDTQARASQLISAGHQWLNCQLSLRAHLLPPFKLDMRTDLALDNETWAEASCDHWKETQDPHTVPSLFPLLWWPRENVSCQPVSLSGRSDQTPCWLRGSCHEGRNQSCPTWPGYLEPIVIARADIYLIPWAQNLLSTFCPKARRLSPQWTPVERVFKSKFDLGLIRRL